MGISSLGAGSSILTQDVIDQLKAVDVTQFVAPLDKKLKEQDTQSKALKVEDALMENVYQSVNLLTQYGLFESRLATASGSAVDINAAASSDIQDFTLEVTTLATKEIDQSGSFTSKTDANIATGVGSITLNIGYVAAGADPVANPEIPGTDYVINYDANTTLENLKDLINKDAGSAVQASIVQIGTGDFRLFLSAKETGTGQAISMTDTVGSGEALNGTALTTGITNVQPSLDASFKYNGLDITRSSNSVSDLLSGVTITLKEVGTSSVSVKQDRENISSKVDNFISKYNDAMYQINQDTLSNKDASLRGVFSSDATIKGMKSSLKNMFFTIGEGITQMSDYGITLDAKGTLSLDSAILNTKLDENPSNVQAFFAGGDFKKSDGTTIILKGSFVEITNEVTKYTKYNAVLDQQKNFISNRTKSLTEQKTLANERLTAKYAIMAKRFSAYDAVISKFNNASSMFTSLVNAQIAAQK